MITRGAINTHLGLVTMMERFAALVAFSLALCAVSVDGTPRDHLIRHATPHVDASYAYETTADGPLDIHVIAHTHDDVGWLKTVDEYFYGSNTSIQNAGVQYILDEVITELEANPDRKFIYVEVAFFMRWWREQTPERQALVRRLVSTKQLEFINGGWCMNDEATTHYEAVIDQMTLGHRFLQENFGVVPRIGWHIDPFGHSAQQASMFARMGFDAFFFARIDYQDYAIRTQQKRMEMIWRGSQSLGSASDMFTSVIASSYCPPQGFLFEWGDEPVMDDPRLENYNMKARADDFVAQAKQRANWYRTNQVLVPFGCDFMFQNANMMFKNMDKLIAYINANRASYGVRAFYSTPSLYTDAVHRANLTWEVKTDDFFPYADGPHAFWTGYFTSRIAIKGYVRTRNAILQAVESLYTTTTKIGGHKLAPDAYAAIEDLRESMGLAQHHDAVSGTEKQHVADDYAKQLSEGSVLSENALATMVGTLINPSSPLAFRSCPLLNESICPSTDALRNPKTSISVVAYNALAWKRVSYVTLPVPVPSVSVKDSTGANVMSQVIKVNDTLYELVFAVTLPALGFATYFVQPTAASVDSDPVPEAPAAGYVLQNQYLSVTLDDTGGIVGVYDKVLSEGVSIKQEYAFYQSSTGTPQDSQASGAYIFRPAQNSSFPYVSGTPQVSFSQGTQVSEMKRIWPQVTQIIRLYADSAYLEITHTLQPINIADQIGKEVVTRLTANITTGGTWYTDAQGIEFQKRQYNFRPSWKLEVTEPVAGNYYPTNMGAYIKDTKGTGLQVTLLTDRSRSSASLGEGQLESMLYRRCLVDDSRGVGEPLNETYVVTMREWLVFSSPSKSSSLYRPASQNLAHPPVLLFGDGAAVAQPQAATYTYAPMSSPLPPNVQLLSLHTVEDNQVLVRLHHLFQVGEDALLSKPAAVDLNGLFSNVEVTNVTEVTLGSTLPVSKLNRLKWNTASSSSSSDLVLSPPVVLKAGAPILVQIEPTDTRTFLLEFKSTSKNTFNNGIEVRLN
eukprot:TRINITY_DN286_c0_g1_i2.p1 TRINITY_DN286_c0_g1~~TRINITY_DN286_c0_g1_i2.p1  ORF type:complete len:1018 (-),score=282.92 TRINITY_DN286_c0_g1_i2:16-3069(-)